MTGRLEFEARCNVKRRKLVVEYEGTCFNTLARELVFSFVRIVESTMGNSWKDMLLIAGLSENDELVRAMIAQIVPSMAFTIMINEPGSSQQQGRDTTNQLFQNLGRSRPWSYRIKLRAAS